MKKVIDSRGEQLQPVKLYLDDIDNLFRILSEISSDVKIEANGYEFQKVNELKELDKESIHTFKIYCRNPHVSLDINNRNTIWLFIDEDLPAQRGAFEKMKQELIQNKRYSIPTILYPILLVFIFNVALFLGIPYLGNPLNYFFILIFFILIMSFFIGYLTYKIYQNKKSIVFLDRRIDSPSFWKRNKDQIIVAVISSILGALVTFLLVQS